MDMILQFWRAQPYLQLASRYVGPESVAAVARLLSRITELLKASLPLLEKFLMHLAKDPFFRKFVKIAIIALCFRAVFNYEDPAKQAELERLYADPENAIEEEGAPMPPLEETQAFYERGFMQHRILHMRSKFMSLFQRNSHHVHLRSEFQNAFDYRPIRINKANAHCVEAAARTSSSYAFQDFAFRNGYSPYFVSHSSRDQDNDALHHFINGKDLVFEAKRTPVTENHLIIMVDVDYYLDMDYWISYNQPIAIITHIPTKLSSYDDGKRYFVHSNKLITHVDGGQNHYEHEIWDYSNDIICSHYGHHTTFCFADIKQVYKDLHIVFLTPFTRLSCWTGHFISEYRLARRQYDQGKYSINVFSTGDNVLVSFIKQGTRSSMEISMNTWEYLFATWRRRRATRKSELQMYDVEKILLTDINVSAGDRSRIATHLFELVTRAPKIVFPRILGKASMVEVPKATPLNYSVVKRKNIDQEQPPYGRLIGPNLVKYPDLVPIDNSSNDKFAVEERVTKVANNKIPPTHYRRWAEWFVTLLVNEPHQGLPYDRDFVMEEQKRPTQKARILKAISAVNQEYTESNFIVKAFKKKESYPHPGPPRIISPVNEHHALDMSCYTYAAKHDFLYSQPWYAPGSTPTEVAERVVDIVHGRATIIETDFSKFDGHISPWLRKTIERATYARWLDRKHYVHFTKRFDKEFETIAFLNDERYHTDARLSGSPFTTDGNTIINAFVSFCANLVDNGGDRGKAYASLGIYAGDDGLTCCSAESFQRVCDDLGLKVKIRVKKRIDGDMPVFLSEVYPDAWFGDTACDPDPLRIARKINFTLADPSIPLTVATIHRLTGYQQRCQGQPIIGKYCEVMIARANKALEEESRGEEGYYSKQIKKHSDRLRFNQPYVVEVMPNQHHKTPTDDQRLAIWRYCAPRFDVGLVSEIEKQLEETLTYDFHVHLPTIPIANDPYEQKSQDAIVTSNGELLFEEQPGSRSRDVSTDRLRQEDDAPRQPNGDSRGHDRRDRRSSRDASSRSGPSTKPLASSQRGGQPPKPNASTTKDQRSGSRKSSKNNSKHPLKPPRSSTTNTHDKTTREKTVRGRAGPQSSSLAGDYTKVPPPTEYLSDEHAHGSASSSTGSRKPPADATKPRGKLGNPVVFVRPSRSTSRTLADPALHGEAQPRT